MKMRKGARQGEGKRAMAQGAGMAEPRALRVARAGTWQGAADRVMLDHEARLLRRRRLVAEGGLAFLVDLEAVTGLQGGDALVLADGRHVAVEAAAEPLLAVEGADLARLAWHIGNRHAPCQIGPVRLLVRADPVMARMLAALGARVTPVMAPFQPEGGAYGHGRTMGHDHADDADARPGWLPSALAAGR